MAKKITLLPNGDLLIPIRNRPAALRTDRDAYVVHPDDDDYAQHHQIYEQQQQEADGRWLRIFGWIGVVFFLPLAMFMGLMLLIQDKRGGGVIMAAAVCWWTVLFLLVAIL